MPFLVAYNLPLTEEVRSVVVGSQPQYYIPLGSVSTRWATGGTIASLSRVFLDLWASLSSRRSLTVVGSLSLLFTSTPTRGRESQGSRGSIEVGGGVPCLMIMKGLLGLELVSLCSHRPPSSSDSRIDRVTRRKDDRSPSWQARG